MADMMDTGKEEEMFEVVTSKAESSEVVAAVVSRDISLTKRI